MTAELISKQLNQYMEELVPERPAELQRMEAYAREHSFPIIGPTAGYACYQIACMSGARNIYEMGSGYGYSTAWFAKAVLDNGSGIVHHVVWDEKLSMRARRHMEILGYSDIVQYTVGEAVQALQKEKGPFDLIFNDINKEDYPKSVAVMEEKLRPGGVLVIDNALRSGRIFDDDDQSQGTNGVRELTRLLTESDSWVTTIWPIRDGLLVAYKR